jgi:hypothetical protein
MKSKREFDEATENEMISYLQSKKAKYNKQFRGWAAPGIRGYCSLYELYSRLKREELSRRP